MILSTAKPPSCLYMYAIELNCIALSYYRSARDATIVSRGLNSKYCDKTVNAQAGSHVCIWRESARALTHVLKHTVSKGYHKEKKKKDTHSRILYLRQQSTIGFCSLGTTLRGCGTTLRGCGCAQAKPSLCFSYMRHGAIYFSRNVQVRQTANWSRCKNDR